MARQDESSATATDADDDRGTARRTPFAISGAASAGARARVRAASAHRASRHSRYKAAGKLDGLGALITGGDSGIGRAVAVLFAREGADVAIVYLPEEQRDAEATRAAVTECGRRCELIPGDLTDAEFCKTAVDRPTVRRSAASTFSFRMPRSRAARNWRELDDADLQRTFETNIFAYMRLARAALRHMKPGAAIIATSSETGIQGTRRLPDYSATKGAVNAFTKSLAIDLLDRGIRVNAVAPGRCGHR